MHCFAQSSARSRARLARNDDMRLRDWRAEKPGGGSIAEEKQDAGEHTPRRRRAAYGPYCGAGVWLKSFSSVTQVKFAAMLVLPLPLYFATLG
jgi:hypothetical protein